MRPQRRSVGDEGSGSGGHYQNARNSASPNDGIVREAPLPPDMWATWTPDNPPRQWIEYRWTKPVAVNESRIWFWADAAAGANAGVAPPRSWRLEYRDGKAWKPVGHPSGYPVALGGYQNARFDSVSTTALRATLDASGNAQSHAAVALLEWEVLRTAPQRAR